MNSPSPHQPLVSEKHRALLAEPARLAFLFILEIPPEISLISLALNPEILGGKSASAASLSGDCALHSNVHRSWSRYLRFPVASPRMDLRNRELLLEVSAQRSKHAYRRMQSWKITLFICAAQSKQCQS